MINKKMTILQILQMHPEAYKVLEGFGMKCSECMAVAEETLEQSARRHKVDLSLLIQKLSKLGS